MASVREIVEGIQEQGEDEEVVYTFTATNVAGGSPTNPAVVVKDESDNFADVTSSTATGSASASGDIITSPTIHSLVAGRTYRVEISFDAGGNTLEHYMRIKGVR